MELPFDPVIPLLGIYPKKSKTLIQKNICTPMFIAALFTMGKTWKQPRCPSIDKCFKKLWHTQGLAKVGLQLWVTFFWVNKAIVTIITCMSLFMWTVNLLLLAPYIYSGILLSHKKEQNLNICDSMDGTRDYMINEISQSMKDKCYMISLIRGMRIPHSSYNYPHSSWVFFSFCYSGVCFYLVFHLTGSFLFFIQPACNSF